MFGDSRFLQFLRIPGRQLPKTHFYTLLVIITCLLFSRYALTLSIILLLIMTLAGQIMQKRIHLASSVFFVLPAFVLILYMVSIYYSDSVLEGLTATRAKAMFLVLPYTLLSLSMISSDQLKVLYHYFITLVLISAAWSLAQIPVRDIDLAGSYAQGQVIPTVIHHIPFSMFAAFAAIFCWMLTFRRKTWRMTSTVIYGILATFFTVFLHILAVRSGLVGFYGGMLFLAVLSFTERKNLVAKSAALLLTAAILAGAYNFLPSLKSKVDYTIYSLKQFGKQEDVGIYSDSRRMISYEAAIELIRRHPLTGVGIGDIKREINAYYDVHYPQVDQQHLHPHNQYLFTAAAIGIPAAAWLLLFNVLLVVHHIRRRDWLLVAFNIILVTSFLVEDMLETQIGVIVYLLFNYLGWKQNSRQAIASSSPKLTSS
jgi:O-antigen ligase